MYIVWYIIRIRDPLTQFARLVTPPEVLHELGITLFLPPRVITYP